MSIIFILGIMAMATGCVRLGMEFDRGSTHHAYHHPRLASDRFYAGTRGIAKHISIRPGLFMVLDICITSFSLVDMPFEIVADTLLL
ncbi:MAG: YceK/YidQ family lipoprotein, partial [Victivallales bacterium]|nr:YceK/YidQ family lipoprotein [Victivallales bacterium]